MVKNSITCLLVMIAIILMAPSAGTQAAGDLSEETQWPREIITPEATVVLYQPQVERFEADRLDVRMAASVKVAKAEEPVFGAVWVRARVETDREERLVNIIALEAVRSRFPGATPEQEDAFADLLKKEVPKWELTESLDRLLASLESAERQNLASEKLKNEPPNIIYSETPAILITLDGKPVLEKIEGSSLMAVVNTPFSMVYRPSEKIYYLMGDKEWYRSRSVTDDWQPDPNPPSDVRALRPEDSLDPEAPTIDGHNSKIIVSTEPAELIFTQGKPQYVPIEGGDVLFVGNTENDILLEPETGRHFLLISGRWYVSKALQGPWAYVAGDALPKSFADIPPDSEKGGVLAGISGTTEAREAVLDAHIPQTAAIVRSEAKLEVEYDGKPQFKQIAGTSIQYAVNSPISVIEVEGRYYAVDNGVWFTSSKPTGPWVVADSVPAQVQDIPPSAPVYNIKYVTVYDATPDIVYVGYTPGYVGTYIHGGTVVYGTGYYYRPWYGHYYYPRPATWGFSVRYSSYYGWSFGLSYSSGPFTLSIGHGWGHYHLHHYHGWWGPPRYRPPYYRPPHHRPPHYRPPYYRPPRPELYRAKQPRADLYAKRSDRMARPAPERRPTRDRPTPSTRPAQKDRLKRANDVYTDRDGNVYRRGERGWERRDGNKWSPSDRASTRPSQPSTRPSKPSVKPSQPSTRPSQPSVRPSQPSARPSQPSTRPAQPKWEKQRSQLERDHQSRQRSTQRTRDFQQSRQGSSKSSRGGSGSSRGGSRGGKGGRTRR